MPEENNNDHMLRVWTEVEISDNRYEEITCSVTTCVIMEHIVASMGNQAPKFLRNVGIRLPIHAQPYTGQTESFATSLLKPRNPHVICFSTPDVTACV